MKGPTTHTAEIMSTSVTKNAHTAAACAQSQAEAPS